MKWLAVALLVACHQGVDGDAATAWLEARGSAAATWESCLRIGTAMHVACGGDARCGLEATRTFSYWCYAGRYAAKSRGDGTLSLSPCFWDRVGDHESRVAFEPWAERTCDQFKLPAKPCKDELRDVVQSCNEDLTGAGP